MSSKPRRDPCLPLLIHDFLLHYLIQGNAQLPKFNLGLFNLSHQLFVGFGHVVKSQDTPAEAEEKVGAEANDGPERELYDKQA